VEEGGGDKEDKASITAWWMDAKKAALDTLKYVPIKIGNNVYRRSEAKKKKDIEQAYKKMTAEEKNDLMWKLAELDVEDTNDNESEAPSPTPA
jgi:hypothetical protein